MENFLTGMSRLNYFFNFVFICFAIGGLCGAGLYSWEGGRPLFQKLHIYDIFKLATISAIVVSACFVYYGKIKIIYW